MTDLKQLEEAQGAENILTGAGEVPAQLCSNPEEQRPINNFQKLPAYEKESSMAAAIDEGLGLV